MGPGSPNAGLFGKRGDGILHGGAVAALLRKSRRDDDRVLDADRGALLKRAENRARRNDDDGEIDRLPDISDRRIAFQAVDIAVIGIDRMNASRKSVLAQHRQKPARDLLQIARCTDQRDTVGRKEGVGRTPHYGGSFLVFSARLVWLELFLPAMAGPLRPIHVFLTALKTWMPGTTSPG